MKLTISTELLQSLIVKSVKGASNNKMIPITGLLAISLESNRLTLVTTDATNYLYIIEDDVEGEDFYVVVQSDVFSKLISRLSCPTVTLKLERNRLVVIGNGEYSIELPLDEDGMLIKYPDPLANTANNFHADEEVEVSLSTIRLINTTASASLSTSLDMPCYTGYYIGEHIVATDGYVICGIDTRLWEVPVLVRPSTLRLLDVFSNEVVSVQKNQTDIIFTTPNAVVCGKIMPELNDYQIDVIDKLLDDKSDSYCSVPKSSVLELLDRLSLFVGVYDQNGIYLTFDEYGIKVTSKQSTSIETIEYKDSVNHVDFTCCIDIEMLRSQVKASTGDLLVIHYGKPNAISLVDNNITQVVALIV